MKNILKTILPILLISIAYLYFANFGYVSATTEQQNYLPQKLSTAKKILIRNHSKLGGAILVEISDMKEIQEFVSSTKISKIENPCACFGFKDIEFVLEHGEIFKINYKDDFFETYISYENPWHFQAKPSSKFRSLIRKHVKNA
jgi:hypothetical protein